MIDTIHFDVLECHRFPTLLAFLKTLASTSDGLVHNRRFTQWHDTGHIMETHKGKIRIPSSNYDVAYVVKHAKNVISFNVSVPKYFYGHNLKMFVPHHVDRDFDYNKGTDLLWNLENTHERMIYFIRYFHSTYLQNAGVKLTDIILGRVDISFNQIFQSVYEKNLYLSCIKKKKIPHSRGTSNNPVYQGGIYLVSRYVTYKIYDKGLEFRKNDIKELRGKIPENDLRHLEKVSSLTLRYEIEFKKSFFKDYVRKEREQYDSSVYFKILENRFGEINIKNYFNTQYLPEINFDSQSMGFFNATLFDLAVRRFYKFLKVYKIEQIEAGDLEKKIMRHNAMAKYKFARSKKINMRKLNIFVQDLIKYGKDALIQFDYYDKRTYYRNMRQLKLLGFESPHVIAPFAFLDNWNLLKYHEFFYK